MQASNMNIATADARVRRPVADAPVEWTLDPPRSLEAFGLHDLEGAYEECVLLRHRLTNDVLPSEVSRAEREVAAGILEGLSNAAIARRRGVAVSTIANQVANLFRRLGVASRAELIARVATTQSPWRPSFVAMRDASEPTTITFARGGQIVFDRAKMWRLENQDARCILGGLADGQWTLLDHATHDGHRFLVVRPRLFGVTDPFELSAIQRDVVAHVALGRSNKLVAHLLGIGVSTVATHLSSAMRKLHVPSRSELQRLYLPWLCERERAF